MVKGLMAKGVPPQPAWLLYIKIAILVLSVIILALSAYACSLVYWASGVPAYMIFITLKTMIIYGLVLFIELRAQQWFFRIGAFVAYLLGIIFWLSGWAWAASWAGIYNVSYYGYGFTYNYGPFGPVLAAIAGLGALVWILSIVNFVIFVRACLADPEGNGAAAATGVSAAEMGAVKPEAQVTSYPEPAYGQQPAQGQQYPQQQYPAQQYPQQAYPQQQYPAQ